MHILTIVFVSKALHLVASLYLGQFRESSLQFKVVNQVYRSNFIYLFLDYPVENISIFISVRKIYLSADVFSSGRKSRDQQQ